MEKSKFNQALDGEINPSEVYAELLGEYEYIEDKLSVLKPLVLQELSNYSEKEVKLCGLTFQKKTDPGKWDFSVIPQWNGLKNKLKGLEEMAKQKFKAAEKGQNLIVADEDGVEIPTPVFSPGGETFAVLKK